MNEIFLMDRYSGAFKIALCFPSSYRVGMSNLAFHKLLEVLNMPRTCVSRFFYDKGKTISPDNFFDLNKADLIIFTLSFEPDGINILKMLFQNNIPLEKKNRTQLIAGGGIFFSLNKNFFKNVFDIQFSGELETFEKEMESLIKKESANKNELKKGLLELSNKSNYQDPFTSIPSSVVLSNEAEFKNIFLVEISRGCRFKCPFCVVSMVYDSFRPASYDEIISKIDKALLHTKKIGLVSALPNSHPDIIKITRYILDKGAFPSFSSLRLELIDKEFLSLLKKSGQNTLTLAIESADINVRKKMGKAFDDNKILKLIYLALNEDIRHFKFYFMAGLPGEQGCAKNIIELIKKVREVLIPYAKEKKVMPLVDVDVSLFVPKPKTPWQNAKMADASYYKDEIKELKRNLFKLGCNVKFDEPKHALTQYILSRAGDDLCTKLCEIIEKGGSINKAVLSYASKL